MRSIAVARDASARRIAADVQALSRPPYTEGGPGITRHAFTAAYARTQEYFRLAFEQVGFDVWCDPIGNLVASNVAAGARCFGLGSHCDSVDHGGAYDGVLGLACALEVCRLAGEQRVDVPLRVISFLEEEGAGFGQLLLGSRLAANAVSDEQLATFADRRGRSFVEAARNAGLQPEHHRQAAVTLDGLTGWIEVHIEQGRVLESEHVDLGLVGAIAGYVHAEEITGKTDHAGATPMGFRSDAAVTAAELVLGLEALARQSSPDTVATVGDLRLLPGAINVIAGTARMTLDMRSVSGNHIQVAEQFQDTCATRTRERAQRYVYTERQRVEPTRLDERLVDVLEGAADALGASSRRMHSGAAHDTMFVARRAPSAMVFVPCRDGISHSPQEWADPAHAALAAHAVLSAVEELST